MRKPLTTTNASDQLAAIDHAYDVWLESEKNEELDQYLSILLTGFAASYSPEHLLPAEYDRFTEIARTLCVAGGMTDLDLNS